MSKGTDTSMVRAEYEARHRAMIERLAPLLAAEKVEIVVDDYRYESFGFWNLTVARDGHRFEVSWDAFDKVLSCTYVGTHLVGAPPLHSIPSLAEQELKAGLEPETLPHVSAFILEHTGRVVRGEVVPPPPEKMYFEFETILGAVGAGLVLVGLILAARSFGLRGFFVTLFTSLNFEALGIAQTIMAGLVLVAVAVYRMRSAALRRAP